MKFRADEISSVIQREIEHFSPEVTRSEVGRVLEVGDGIGGCTGLLFGADGLVKWWWRLKTASRASLANLEESSVGVMVLGDYTPDRRR